MLAIFRLTEATRYLIRTIIEICKGVLPFMVVFWFSMMVLCVGFNTIRDDPWSANYLTAWRLAFGDFEDQYPTLGDQYLFKLGSIFMPLILLNLLIAIMGDIFS